MHCHFYSLFLPSLNSASRPFEVPYFVQKKKMFEDFANSKLSKKSNEILTLVIILLLPFHVRSITSLFHTKLKSMLTILYFYTRTIYQLFKSQLLITQLMQYY